MINLNQKINSVSYLKFTKKSVWQKQEDPVPRTSLGNLKKILLPLPRIKSPLLSAPAYTLITIMTTQTAIHTLMMSQIFFLPHTVPQNTREPQCYA